MQELHKGAKDPLQSTIGDFGRWQFYVSLLMSLLRIPLAWIQMSIVFLAPPTQFWCKPPLELSHFTQTEWLNFTKSHMQHLQKEGLNTGFCSFQDYVNHTNNTIPCSNGFEYDKTIFSSTIITEWNLVCDQERLINVSQIILMIGILIGNVFFGVFADRHGRKLTLTICIVIQAIFGLLSAWMPWFWGFVVSRFFMAIANGGTMVASFVMCIEIVGGKWRTIVPILYQMPFGFGYSVMSFLAYELREWRYFQTTLSGLSALYILYVWIIPESPRWLLVRGRQKKAILILERAAKINKIPLEKYNQELTNVSNTAVDVTNRNLGDLFKTRQLRYRTLLLCSAWFLSGLSFYTISQYLGHLGKNLFFTTSMGGLISLPGMFVCLFFIGRYGRRVTITTFSILTAVCFLAILGFPKGSYVNDWPRLLFAGIGLIGISVSIPALYLFSGELYPTVVRNAGIGLSTMFARVGSIIAPLVISLHNVTPFLPLVLLGTFGFLEGLLTLLLPETKGTPLPELVSDLNDRMKSNNTETGKDTDYFPLPTDIKEETNNND